MRRALFAVIFVAVASSPARDLARCLVAGDSIAVYVGAFTACMVDAKESLHSGSIISRIHPADVVVISVGSNDRDDEPTAENINAIRARASAASQVMWIVPNEPRSAKMILSVATSHGDQVVRFVPGADHVHPECPRCVAVEIIRRIDAPQDVR